jgi:hypothetical protein
MAKIVLEGKKREIVTVLARVPLRMLRKKGSVYNHNPFQLIGKIGRDEMI